MLWFNFILGLTFISLCFKLIIIHYHTPKQREIKFKPRIKLNHNTYTQQLEILVRAMITYSEHGDQTKCKMVTYKKLQQ